MKKNHRIILLLIVIGILAVTCLVFRIFILETVLKPLALTFWLILRFSVLSIDQSILWGLLIGVCVIIFIFQLVPLISGDEYVEFGSPNLYMQKLELWQTYFSVKTHNPFQKNRLKRELADMLVSLYASRKRLNVDYELFDDFKKGKIQLPENVYAFLFHIIEKKPFFDFSGLYNKISGRKAGEYKRNLEECLVFLENFMEINDE